MADFSIDHMIYGRTIVDKQPSDQYNILAKSGTLTANDLIHYRDLVAVEPLQVESAQASQGLALTFASPNTFVLIRTHNQAGDINAPIYQYVRIPYDVLASMRGWLQPLVDVVSQPIEPFTIIHDDTPSLKLPSPPLTKEQELTILNALIHDIFGGDYGQLTEILSAAIQETGVYIYNFASELETRIQLIQGLMVLLPLPARLYLSFATNMRSLVTKSPRIVFGNDVKTARKTQFDWKNKTFTNHPETRSKYADFLLQQWDGDVEELYQLIQSLGTLAEQISWHEHFPEKLNLLATRQQADDSVMNDNLNTMPEIILNIMESELAPSGELRQQYTKELLNYALNDRDIGAIRIVANEMAKDPKTEEYLSDTFVTALEQQPDSVYSFARIHLQHTVDEKWLSRLKQAAEMSLSVALTDSDSETLINWLQLIAREPIEYGLGNILQGGILAAQTRSHEDGALAVVLLELAVKHEPTLLQGLLNNDDFLSSLPKREYDALILLEPSEIAEVATDSREVFLLTLNQVYEQAKKNTITATSVRSLWGMYRSAIGKNLPDHYRPVYLIRTLTDEQPDCFTQDALEMLLVLALNDEEDDFFIEIAGNLASHNNFDAALEIALQGTTRSLEDILSLINSLSTSEIITSQQYVDILFTLLTAWDWQTNSLPLVEQLSRFLQQRPDLTVPRPALWKMLEISSTERQESMTRVATRRLLKALEEDVIETQLTDNLLRLLQNTQWHQAIVKMVLDWWRRLTLGMNVAQLQRLDKLFVGGNRLLENPHRIVQTSTAIKKLIGNRNLEEFANDVNTTYNVLQDFVEAFESTPRQHDFIDQQTIRLQLQLRGDELSEDNQHILAVNMRELAHLITSSADNRSKRSIIRSDETLERQIQTGKHQPNSAVDMMKWFSGYLDGMQDQDDE